VSNHIQTKINVLKHSWIKGFEFYEGGRVNKLVNKKLYDITSLWDAQQFPDFQLTDLCSCRYSDFEPFQKQ
jgi:hypothetical protein